MFTTAKGQSIFARVLLPTFDTTVVISIYDYGRFLSANSATFLSEATVSLSATSGFSDPGTLTDVITSRSIAGTTSAPPTIMRK